MSIKLIDADSVGEEAASEESPLEICCVSGSANEVRRCSGCRATNYCSKLCQMSHREHHAAYCNAISELEEFEKERMYGERSVRQKLLDNWKHLKIAKLVGQKPMLRCRFGRKSFDGLWDTGSMITMVDRLWLEENFPDEEIVPVMEFLEGERLTIRAANKSLIPFDGVVVLKFSLGDEHEGFWVPVMVSSQPISEPIIGYNIIEHLVLKGTDKEHELLKLCLKGAIL